MKELHGLAYLLAITLITACFTVTIGFVAHVYCWLFMQGWSIIK